MEYPLVGLCPSLRDKTLSSIFSLPNNQRSKQLEPGIGRSRGGTVKVCLVGDGVLASSAVSVLESQASLYIGKGDKAWLEERNDYQRMA